jgi:hypothetical protein
LDKPTVVDPKFVGKPVQARLEQGATNADLMREGLAPIGSDGRPINLHHILGEEPGPMVELLGSSHSRLQKPLHGLIEPGRSFRNAPGLLTQYNAFRRAYWMWRLSTMEKK